MVTAALLQALVLLPAEALKAWYAAHVAELDAGVQERGSKRPRLGSLKEWMQDNLRPSVEKIRASLQSGQLDPAALKKLLLDNSSFRLPCMEEAINGSLAEGLKQAEHDLQQKAVRLSQSHYGSLRWIPVYAASGFHISFHAMMHDGCRTLE
ncbi:hypothetical protein WJX73_004936 [Symbiochloris irregularis]|uniref:Uncharacterized protein n=1 Tax=Symbiochloris irregularis TaxID=706552 RepID=A0AAW1PLC0_9CHLO